MRSKQLGFFTNQLLAKEAGWVYAHALLLKPIGLLHMLITHMYY